MDAPSSIDEFVDEGDLDLSDKEIAEKIKKCPGPDLNWHARLNYSPGF